MMLTHWAILFKAELFQDILKVLKNRNDLHRTFTMTPRTVLIGMFDHIARLYNNFFSPRHGREILQIYSDLA